MDSNEYMSVKNLLKSSSINIELGTKESNSNIESNVAVFHCLNAFLNEYEKHKMILREKGVMPRRKADGSYTSQKVFEKLREFYSDSYVYPEVCKINDSSMLNYVKNAETVFKVLLDCTNIADIEILKLLSDTSRKQPYLTETLLNPDKDIMKIFDVLFGDYLSYQKGKERLSGMNIEAVLLDSSKSYEEKALAMYKFTSALRLETGKNSYDRGNYYLQCRYSKQYETPLIALENRVKKGISQPQM